LRCATLKKIISKSQKRAKEFKRNEIIFPIKANSQRLMRKENCLPISKEPQRACSRERNAIFSD
jgi:hypothetical protein